MNKNARTQEDMKRLYYKNMSRNLENEVKLLELKVREMRATIDIDQLQEMYDEVQSKMQERMEKEKAQSVVDKLTSNEDKSKDES